MRRPRPALRSSAGAGMATSGHLSVSNYSACRAAALALHPEHGVRVVKLSWAEPGSRFTALFEALAITWLKYASQKAVAEQLQLSWDEVHAIMERAVKRGLARRHAEEIPQLGIDERAVRKGHKDRKVRNDLKRNCVRKLRSET